MTSSLLLLWATQQSRSAFSLLLKFTHTELYFQNWVPHPGPLQTANLPVESCRALESWNTQHFHKFVAKNDLTFGKWHSEVYHLSYQRQSFSYCCLYQISFLFNEGLLAVVILTWHDALVHQLLPGSPLLKPQLQDWKKREKKMCYKIKKGIEEYLT